MMYELSVIEKYYGNTTAKRSGVPLINHIREGLVILEDVGAPYAAKAAYCLHPLFQADKDLKDNWSMLGSFNTEVVALVMEYRSQANAWLSDKVYLKHGVPFHTGNPSPGPIKDVAYMLLADKLQNCGDFLKYHKDTHPRSMELEYYFEKWLQILT